MRPQTVFCVALVQLLAGSAVAQDDYARPGPYLGLGGTYAFRWVPGDFDDDLGLGATVRADNTGGLNARVGYRVSRWLAGELEYEWLDGFDVEVEGGGGGFTLRSHAVTANGKLVYPGWGRFQPWMLAGIGVSIYEAQDRSGLADGLDSTSVGFGARMGFGLDVYLTESWLVNLGAEGFLDTTQIENSMGGDLDQFWYVPIQLGIQYRF
jgi:opacity protein-like surface antigen